MTGCSFGWSPTTNDRDAVELAEHLGISVIRHDGKWHALRQGNFEDMRPKASGTGKLFLVDINLENGHGSFCLAVVLCVLGKETEVENVG